jgi:hypothetical protein
MDRILGITSWTLIRRSSFFASMPVAPRLVGPIMKASKGKANPAQVNELLMKKLS